MAWKLGSIEYVMLFTYVDNTGKGIWWDFKECMIR